MPFLWIHHNMWLIHRAVPLVLAQNLVIYCKLQMSSEGALMSDKPVSLDLDFVRKQFPAFEETSLQGQAFL